MMAESFCRFWKFCKRPSIMTESFCCFWKCCNSQHHDWVFLLLPEVQQNLRVRILCNVLLEFWADCYIFIYTHCYLYPLSGSDAVMECFWWQLITAICNESDDGLTHCEQLESQCWDCRYSSPHVTFKPTLLRFLCNLSLIYYCSSNFYFWMNYAYGVWKVFCSSCYIEEILAWRAEFFLLCLKTG